MIGKDDLLPSFCSDKNKLTSFSVRWLLVNLEDRSTFLKISGSAPLCSLKLYLLDSDPIC